MARDKIVNPNCTLPEVVSEATARVPEFSKELRGLNGNLLGNCRVRPDQQVIADLYKAVKDLLETVDRLHDIHYPAKQEMHPS